VRAVVAILRAAPAQRLLQTLINNMKYSTIQDLALAGCVIGLLAGCASSDVTSENDNKGKISHESSTGANKDSSGQLPMIGNQIPVIRSARRPAPSASTKC
jgi:hypothetical protein